jgi:hypothetical protein
MEVSGQLHALSLHSTSSITSTETLDHSWPGHHYADRGFCSFIQPLQANSEIYHHFFTIAFFQIISVPQSIHHLTVYTLDTKSVFKLSTKGRTVADLRTVICLEGPSQFDFINSYVFVYGITDRLSYL